MGMENERQRKEKNGQARQNLPKAAIFGQGLWGSSLGYVRSLGLVWGFKYSLDPKVSKKKGLTEPPYASD